MFEARSVSEGFDVPRLRCGLQSDRIASTGIANYSEAAARPFLLKSGTAANRQFQFSATGPQWWSIYSQTASAARTSDDRRLPAAHRLVDRPPPKAPWHADRPSVARLAALL